MSLNIKDPSWLLKGTVAFVALGAMTVYALQPGSPGGMAQPASLLERSTAPDDDDTPLRRILPEVPLLPGSGQTDPILMLVNGARANVVRSFVDLTPDRILDYYEKIARGSGAREIEKTDGPSDSMSAFSPKYGPNLPAIEARSLALRGKAMRVDNDVVKAITWVDHRGRRITVHTLPGEQRGSWYFITAFENPLVLFGPGTEKDNPGSDLAGIPRPPQSRRLVNMGGFAVSGFSVAVYESRASMELTYSYYGEYLPSKGWKPADLAEPGRTLIDRAGAHIFSKDRSMVWVLVDPVTRPGWVQTSIFLFEVP